ncbi:MAG: hypothetical protein QOE77_183 [Blastocatellia bacterium]|jgi:hypothetical protein|nr:hypothetical protein [Blastocatellia bacterium]
MALTGELSDLSLAELIEFFCNQRKTGCLKIIYPHGAGYFYLQAGSVVHARIGSLRGIDAVYSALTLPNASFTFSPLVEAPERSINQPWTQVVLEGLRRMDEGVIPGEAFPAGYTPDEDEGEFDQDASPAVSDGTSHLPGFLSGFGGDAASRRSKLVTAAVVAVIVLIVAVVGVPAGWYSKKKAVAVASQPAPVVEQSATSAPVDMTTAPVEPAVSDSSVHASDAASLAARREREARDRERAKAREEKADAAAATKPPVVQDGSGDAAKKPTALSSAPKKITVQVSYDENGRVTQASGGDATALRIARQKRFPAGKAGSTTVTIPIN